MNKRLERVKRNFNFKWAFVFVVLGLALFFYLSLFVYNDLLPITTRQCVSTIIVVVVSFFVGGFTFYRDMCD